ncbi:amidohydrolase [Candidatus Fermentibacteria bacterium]|nr:amidohydrolase [Candidatus Fermentibacteria bacterium]
MRHRLHQAAELSRGEVTTAGLIEEFLRVARPDGLLTRIGGYGVLAVYEGTASGPTVLLRCELDALPIAEQSSCPHPSATPGVSHKCGHDGHMAILCGVAQELAWRRRANGRVVLLFQPAEETGEGASMVLDDARFAGFHPDWVFALHNLPGYPLGEVLLRSGPFASGSRGIAIHLTGATAHAAEPERGQSPALAVGAVIAALSSLPQDRIPLHEAAKVTVIHVRVGEVAFGTTPGEGVVMATMRAHTDRVLDELEAHCRRLGSEIGRAHGLTARIEIREPFPATVNSPDAVKLLRSVADAVGLKNRFLDHPFAWSEDFGHFTSHYRGALFGLGAGAEHPALHHPFYEFPDTLLTPGIRLLHGIALAAGGMDTQDDARVERS